MTETSKDIQNSHDGVIKNINHAEFVTGFKENRLGFKVLIGEPSRLLRGRRLAIFNLIVMLNIAGPLLIVPYWAHRQSNWWLIFGIPVSYVASISAAGSSKLFVFYSLLCIGVWMRSGFSIYQYCSYYFLCALWGYIMFGLAEKCQKKYVSQILIDDREFFDKAISDEIIQIVSR